MTWQPPPVDRDHDRPRHRPVPRQLHRVPAGSAVRARGVTSVQYWESTEALLAYARGATHSKAWREFHRRRDGSAGIWHETFEIGRAQTAAAGDDHAEEGRGFEAIYADMPPTGLGALGTRPTTREDSGARHRLRRSVRSHPAGREQ